MFVVTQNRPCFFVGSLRLRVDFPIKSSPRPWSSMKVFMFILPSTKPHGNSDCLYQGHNIGVSINWVTPKSSILIGVFPDKPSSHWGSPMAMDTANLLD